MTLDVDRGRKTTKQQSNVLELLSTDFKFKFHFQTEINSVQCHMV